MIEKMVARDGIERHYIGLNCPSLVFGLIRSWPWAPERECQEHRTKASGRFALRGARFDGALE